MDDKPFQRLPTSVAPINYDVSITPKFQDFTFTGNQAVDVKVRYNRLSLPFSTLYFELN